MKLHRSALVLFTSGFIVYCCSNFWMQKRTDNLSYLIAFIYLLGIIISLVALLFVKKKKEEGELDKEPE